MIKKEKKEKLEIPDGLKQSFKMANGKMTTLEKGLKEGDWWISKGRAKKTILTHGAVQKIADVAGVSKDVQYTVLTQPDAYNNYQYTIQAKVCRMVPEKELRTQELGILKMRDEKKTLEQIGQEYGCTRNKIMEICERIENPKMKQECVTEIGEANRSNLGSKGRANPANMAQKRAYDRCVFRLLGISGLLSEEELSDEDEEETKMENLSQDEVKKIAPLINKLLTAKTPENLNDFNKEMKEKAKDYNPAQLEYLRKLYGKRVGELVVREF